MPIKDTDLGKIKPIIGTVKGNQLRFLAHVGPCDRENCQFKEICPYNQSNRNVNRCHLFYTFLSSLYKDWVDTINGIGDMLNQIQLDRIGTHLMPLYHQLARFELETTLYQKTYYEDSKGRVRTYPQFGEVRQVQSAIRQELKDLKLEAMWEKKFGKGKAKPVGRIKRPMIDDQIYEDGRQGAYEAMVKEAQESEIIEDDE